MNFIKKHLGNQIGAAESKAPMVITIIILTAIGFLSYKFIPVKLRNMRFENAVQLILNIDYTREYKDFARGGFNEYTMRERILESIRKHQIPLKDPEKQLKVEWPENRIFTAEINYVEIIKLPIYGPYEWKFHVYVEQDPHAGKALVEKKE